MTLKSVLLLIVFVILVEPNIALSRRDENFTTSCNLLLTEKNDGTQTIPRLDIANDPTTVSVEEEAVCLLQRFGVVVMDHLVSSSEMDQLTLDLDRDTTGTFWGAKGSFAGEQTTRNAAKPLGESSIAQALAVHPTILGIVHRLLLPYTKRVVLGTVSAINVVGPRSPEEDPAPPQIIHRDDSMWAGDWITNMACPNNGAYPNLSVSVMWAVSDFTMDNGATQFALGSHRQCPRTPEPTPEMVFRKAIMNKGSVVLWLGGTFHGASSPSPLTGNVVRESRRGLLNIYNLGYLKSEHNFFNAIPRDIIMGFDKPLLDLLGYYGENAVEHPWYVGPVYTQPYLGSPLGNAAGGEGVQYAVEPDSVWEIAEQGDVVLL